MALDRAGYALHAMASLPHISVAGGIATGTHGSGDEATGLASAVVGLELIGADGELHHLHRRDPDFPGALVGLGALGVVTRVTMRIVPAYRMRQYVLQNVPWTVVCQDFDAITALGESVSVFTSWHRRAADSIWLKRRTDRPDGGGAPHLPGATAAAGHQHPVPGADATVCTPQMGLPGAWYERLPHFRMGFTPSAGAEIQVEYVVDRAQAVPVLQAMIGLWKHLAPLLHIGEIRSIAADDLWLSPAFGRDSVSVHLTLDPAPQRVAALLPVLDETLALFAALPHWAKWFDTDPARLAQDYPMLPAFRDLVRRWDPQGCFGNEFLDRWVFGQVGA